MRKQSRYRAGEEIVFRHTVRDHDRSVRRTTGRRGRVENLTLEAIRRLDAGHQYTPDRGRTFPYRGRGLTVPTFDEVLEAFPEARLNIEIKPSRPGIEEAVIEAIHRFRASGRILIAARQHEILERFRVLNGNALTSFSKKEVRQLLARLRAGDLNDYRPAGVALQVPERYGRQRVVSPAVIEAATVWESKFTFGLSTIPQVSSDFSIGESMVS